MMSIDSRDRSMHPSLSPSPTAIYPPQSGYSSKINMNSYQAAVQNVTIHDFNNLDLQLNVDAKNHVFDPSLGPATPSQLPSFVSPTELSHEASSPGFASDSSSYTASHAYDSEGLAYDGMDMLSATSQGFTHEPSPALAGDYEWPQQHAHAHNHHHHHHQPQHQHQQLYEPRQLPSQPAVGFNYPHSVPQLHMAPTLPSHSRYIKHEDSSSADGDDDEDDDDYTDGHSPRKTRRRSTPHDKARITCHICGTPFARTFNYNTHMATHDPNRQRPFVCKHSGCDKRFYRQTDLNRHDQSVHVKSKAFKCDWCDKGFPRKDSLDRHRQDGCLQRHKVRAKLHKVTKQRRGGAQQPQGGSTSPSAMRTLSPHFLGGPEEALRLAHDQRQGSVYYPDWQARL